MSEPVKKNVRVIGAQYSEEAKSFLLMVESPDIRFATQIPIASVLNSETANSFDGFSQEQKKACTDVFCREIIGKHINVVFDPDLDEKLKDNFPIRY